MNKIKIESDQQKYHTLPSKGISSDSSSDLINSSSYNEFNRNPADIPKSATTYIDENGDEQKITVEDLLPSQSNPYFNIRLRSMGGNEYPMTDEASQNRPDLYKEISVIDLIENTSRGASLYDPEDFLYVRDFDSLKLNRLITLRRFAHPVVDDIFTSHQTEPDIARLLTYFDQETNKLSDILKMSLGLNWKDLESRSEKASMEGGSESGISGIAGTVMRFVDPKYGQESMAGRAATNHDPQHDENRVYGPVDSIAKTKIREVGLTFDNKIPLEFNFEMKSHNGINQKAAFIDLLSNIILICTNDAKFWGGARYWVGPQPSKYMKDLKALDSTDWKEYVSKGLGGMKTFMQKFESKGSAVEQLKQIANNAMNLALGSIINKLGRTGIPVMNSLLTGNPVGMWHLTIGNPNNPIVVMGDLIIEDAVIDFGDELGYDDFPTTMKLTLTLTHAKPKGRAEIENMFNCGQGRTYLKPKDVFKNNTTSSQSNPETLNNSTNKNKEQRFGEYTLSDISRNATELWSFLSDKA